MCLKSKIYVGGKAIFHAGAIESVVICESERYVSKLVYYEVWVFMQNHKC